MTATDERDTERERLINNLSSEIAYADRSFGNPNETSQRISRAIDMLRADAGKDETIRKLRATLSRAGRWMATHKDCQSGYGIIAEIAALTATTQPVKDGGKES